MLGCLDSCSGDREPRRGSGISANIDADWSTPFNGETGVPVFSIYRDGVLVEGASGSGLAISDSPLSNGCTNYNPYVGSF